HRLSHALRATRTASSDVAAHWQTPGDTARDARGVGSMSDEAAMAAMQYHAERINSMHPAAQDAFHSYIAENQNRYTGSVLIGGALMAANRTSPNKRRERRNNDDVIGDELPKPTIALELMERDMPAIQYLRDPWIAEGLNIMAGRPKLGKTTLLRQKLAAVA